MPKPKKPIVVSDKCRICGMFGTCPGRVLPPDEFCLGFTDKQSSTPENMNSVSGNAQPKNAISFVSRAGNGSIYDDCDRELDGVCKLTWAVGLSKVKECKDFTSRKKEAV